VNRGFPSNFPAAEYEEYRFDSFSCKDAGNPYSSQQLLKFF
jgi:hypothetical protein